MFLTYTYPKGYLQIQYFAWFWYVVSLIPTLNYYIYFYKDGCSSCELTSPLILENIKKDKVYLMEQISSYIIDCDGKTEVEKTLMCFLSIKEKVCDNKFLYKIKAKI